MNYLKKFLEGELLINIYGASVEELEELDRIIKVNYNSGHSISTYPEYAKITSACLKCQQTVLGRRLFVVSYYNQMTYKEFIEKVKAKPAPEIKIKEQDIIKMFT